MKKRKDNDLKMVKFSNFDKKEQKLSERKAAQYLTCTCRKRLYWFCNEYVGKVYFDIPL